MALEIDPKSPGRSSSLWLPTAGIRERYQEVHNWLIAGAKIHAAPRILNFAVDLHSSEAVDNRFTSLIADNGIPEEYSDHQGHGDGIALAKVTRRQRKLAARAGYPFKGHAITMAKSWDTGHQGADLKNSYDLLKEAALKWGLVTLPSTRTVDELRYGLPRDQMVKELRPFIEKLHEGFGIALLPEGSVEAGRLRLGATSGEDIKGMQKVTNNNLIDFYQLAKRVGKRTGKKPFFAPSAFHGSYRFIESIPGKEPKLTKLGKRMLFMAAIGLPLGRFRIQATMLMPFTEEEIIADLGSKWVEDGEAFNTYAMKKIAIALPPQARGYYGEQLKSAA